MYRVTCKQCGASGLAEDGNRLQQAVGCSCCVQPMPHNHDAAANACPGAGKDDLTQQHPGAACAHPLGGTACNAVTEVGQDCPGGHCFPGVEGCTVCRPLTVEFVGVVGMAPASGMFPGGAR